MSQSNSKSLVMFKVIQFIYIPSITGRLNNIIYLKGCSFTKYCKDTCELLSLSGWVKNSKKGTIVGKVQGEKPKIDEM